MNDTAQTIHLAPADVPHGRAVHLRVPRLDELAFIRMLWGDPETMAPVGGAVERQGAGEPSRARIRQGRTRCLSGLLLRPDRRPAHDRRRGLEQSGRTASDWFTRFHQGRLCRRCMPYDHDQGNVRETPKPLIGPTAGQCLLADIERV